MQKKPKSNLGRVLQELTAKDLSAGFSYATDDSIWRNAPPLTNFNSSRVEKPRNESIPPNQPVPPPPNPPKQPIPAAPKPSAPVAPPPRPETKPKIAVPAGESKNSILSAFSRQQEMAQAKTASQRAAEITIIDDVEDEDAFEEPMPSKKAPPPPPPPPPPVRPAAQPEWKSANNYNAKHNEFDPPSPKRIKIDVTTPSPRAPARNRPVSPDIFDFGAEEDDILANIDIDEIVATRSSKNPTPPPPPPPLPPPRAVSPAPNLFARPIAPLQRSLSPVAVLPPPPAAPPVTIKPDPGALPAALSNFSRFSKETMQSLLADIKDELLEVYELLDTVSDAAREAELRQRLTDLRKRQKDLTAAIEAKVAANTPSKTTVQVREYVPSTDGRPVQTKATSVVIDLVDDDDDYPLPEATQFDEAMTNEIFPEFYDDQDTNGFANPPPLSRSSSSSSNNPTRAFDRSWEAPAKSPPAAPLYRSVDEISPVPKPVDQRPNSAPPSPAHKDPMYTASDTYEAKTPEERHYGRKAFPWSNELDRINSSVFGHNGYRANQLAIVNAIMDSKDVFVTMPTGGGKSLCYQLPALCSAGVTIVIEPLLSLIEDQVRLLRALDIPCGSLTSATDDEERAEVLRQLSSPKPSLKLLYVTPEKICSSDFFVGKLHALHRNGKLTRFIIDEAHCVSQWGHEFRPDYKALGNIRRSMFPTAPIVALTATATNEVKADILDQLCIRRSCIGFYSSFNRPNLYWEVRTKKKDAITEIAEWIKTHHNTPGNKSGIIYCLSRNECELVAQKMCEQRIRAHHYHAGMSPQDRSSIQSEWTSGKVDVICATIAFGMGINKADVRYVIHYSMPKSVEGFYQEAGRAGRDGKPAQCILYFSPLDKGRLKNITFKSDMPVQVRNMVFRRLDDVDRFCMNTGECRRVLLLQYFGEKYDKRQCLTVCEGCDNCNQAEIPLTDVTDIARSIVTTVREAPDLSRPTIASILKGTALGGGRNYDHLSTHKKHAGEDKDTIHTILQTIAQEGLISENFHKNNFGGSTTYVPGPRAATAFSPTYSLKLRIKRREFAKSSGTSSTGKKRERGKRKISAASADPGVLDFEYDDDAESYREARDQLYSELIVLRDELAATDRGVLQRFANDRLDILVEHLPITLDEMNNLDGIGPSRAKKFGGEQLVQKLEEVVKAVPALKAARQRTKRSGDRTRRAPTPQRSGSLNLSKYQNPNL